MKKAIVKLGYRPEVVPSRVRLLLASSRSGSIPEPIASAVTEAEEMGKLLFIDFYAEWCGACRILDRTTFKDPTVQLTLQDFVFLKVDAELHPEALLHFDVVAMPTLIVLNTFGVEIYRQVGPLDAVNLTRDLVKLGKDNAQ